MASETCHRMIVGAARPLAGRGLQETSFSKVLQLTGAPRGSSYHHCPKGKDQLDGSTIEFAGSHAMSPSRGEGGGVGSRGHEFFLHVWREVLTRSRFQAGCSVLAVTVATDSPQLLQQVAGCSGPGGLRSRACSRPAGSPRRMPCASPRRSSRRPKVRSCSPARTKVSSRSSRRAAAHTVRSLTPNGSGQRPHPVESGRPSVRRCPSAAPESTRRPSRPRRSPERWCAHG